MFRSDREPLPDDREWPEGHPECRGVVERPSLDDREWSSVRPGCPGVVEKPFRMSGRHSRMSGSVRKALPNDREALSDVREWSGVCPGCLGVVGRPSRMIGSGRETLPNARE